jgi:outer membrane protein TolC
MRRMIILLSLTAFSFAETIGLEALLENAQQPKQIEKMIEHKFNALESKSLANTQSTPLTFNPSLSRSVSSIESGFEYEIGFSKELKLGNIKALEKTADRLNNEAQSVEQKKLLVGFSNRLKNAYHQYCLDQEYVHTFQKKYERFTLLYDKKKKAYAEDEIAKTELLQIELEKNSLKNKLYSFSQQVEDKRQSLLALSSFGQEERISCQEIYPLSATFHSENNHFELTQKAYEKRLHSTQVSLKRHSKKIDTIEVSTAYLRELERDVYTIGVSIPLNFSSRKSEYERASLMHKSSALSSQNEQFLAQRSYEIHQLEARLQRAYDAIVNQEENIKDFKNKLLPLMQKSYEYGESSVIEYLLSQQQLSGKETILLEKKKDYYETLFTLYNLSEKR